MAPLVRFLLCTGLSNAVVATLLALAVWVVTRFVRHPGLAHALWLLVLVKLISPALIELPVAGWASSISSVIQTPEVPDNLANPLGETDFAFDRLLHDQEHGFDHARTSHAALRFAPAAILAELPALLAMAWIAGTVAFLFVVGIRLRHFAVLMRRTAPASESLCVEVQRLARDLNIRRIPDVRATEAAVPPLVWAAGTKPVLLLPFGLMDELDPDERRTLLAHELVHLRRHDARVRWFELAVLGVYWWHPIAWLATRRVQQAAEQCCDATVVTMYPAHARAYARTLLKTVEFLADSRSAMPIAGMAFSQAVLLKRRFEMILQGRPYARLPRAIMAVLAIAALAVLPMSIAPLRANQNRSDDAPTVAVADAESSQTHKAAPAEEAKSADLEERLRRLEEQVRGLTPASSGTATSEAPASKTSAEMTHDGRARFEQLSKDVTRQRKLVDTNFARHTSSEVNLRAVMAAYDRGTVKLDVVLAAQRSALSSEIDYAETVLGLVGGISEPDRKFILASVAADATIVARERALATWRSVKKLYDAGAEGGDAELEAQAREQYFLLRGQAENAASNVYEAENRLPKEATP